MGLSHPLAKMDGKGIVFSIIKSKRQYNKRLGKFVIITSSLIMKQNFIVVLLAFGIASCEYNNSSPTKSSFNPKEDP